MTATQSQIKDAKDALYLLYSAAVESEYRTYGDPDEHYAVVSALLQSALDTQKPAGDAAIRFVDEMLSDFADQDDYAFMNVEKARLVRIKAALTGDCGGGDFVSVPVDLIHKVKVLINFHVKRGACIDIDDKLFNEGEIYSELNRAHLAALSADKPAVFYCENGKNLDGLEQGALAVLSNLMMKTNATSAEFMIGNEKDGEFYFTCSRNAPQPVEEIEGLEEAITMSASACYMEGVRAYYDTTWIEALVEASRRYLALTADNAKRGRYD